MGAAIGDFDNDGDLDWFVSSIWDPDGVAEGHWGVTGNRLYRGLGDGVFEDATDAAGVRDGLLGLGRHVRRLRQRRRPRPLPRERLGQLGRRGHRRVLPGRLAALRRQRRRARSPSARPSWASSTPGQGRGVVELRLRSRRRPRSVRRQQRGPAAALPQRRRQRARLARSRRCVGQAPNSEAIGARRPGDDRRQRASCARSAPAATSSRRIRRWCTSASARIRGPTWRSSGPAASGRSCRRSPAARRCGSGSRATSARARSPPATVRVSRARVGEAGLPRGMARGAPAGAREGARGATDHV